jgi:ERF superfamily
MNMEQIAVYKAINAVQSELAKIGISKDRKNQQQGYSFRGIDDVYGALSPLLAQHGLCVLPRMLTRTVNERETQKGGVLFYVTVEAEFDLVAIADGSKHTIRTFGEAMDSGDKATNKAMSAAYKYAAFQTFAIPTEGDNDADAHVHEVATPTLAESIVVDHIAALEGAGDKEALSLAYKAAVGEAKKLNDTAALGRFQAAMLAQEPRFSQKAKA